MRSRYIGSFIIFKSGNIPGNRTPEFHPQLQWPSRIKYRLLLRIGIVKYGIIKWTGKVYCYRIGRRKSAYCFHISKLIPGSYLDINGPISGRRESIGPVFVSRSNMPGRSPINGDFHTTQCATTIVGRCTGNGYRTSRNIGVMNW